MPKVVAIPAGRKFRIVYWDEESKAMRVSDQVDTQSEALKLAESILGKHSTRNLEIHTLAAIMTYDGGAGSIIIPGNA